MSSFVNILANRCRPATYQQVRWARKSFRLRIAYGLPPLTQPDQVDEAEKCGEMEELAYKKIRFALSSDTCSPLWDKDLDRFTKIVMKGGRKNLAESLMHGTFYEIKTIQYRRWQKKLRQQEEAAAAAEANEQVANKGSQAREDESEEDKIEMDPMVIFKTALRNCEPILITRKVKRGGATYQVPYPIVASQSEWFAAKWLLQAVKERPKPRVKLFPEVMANELLDAYHKRGKVIKKKDDVHKLADANKAYAHYRWG